MQNNPAASGEYAAIQRHLERLDERLDERTRDLVTRQDLEALRKEVVTRDLFESQLSLFKAEITRLQTDFEDLKTEQASRSERLWMRFSPVIAGLAFVLALIEFLSHIHFTP